MAAGRRYFHFLLARRAGVKTSHVEDQSAAGRRLAGSPAAEAGFTLSGPFGGWNGSLAVARSGTAWDCKPAVG